MNPVARLRIPHAGNPLCWHLLLLSLALVLLQFFQPQFLFVRELIQQGEVWRIFTGNLVHTNGYHLTLNLAGVLFICLLFKDYLSIKKFYFSLLITTISVGLGIFFFSPSLHWYAGLSGALYGLFIVAASLALKHRDILTGLPVLIGIPVKLWWDSRHTELTQQSAELIGAPIATDAHLYGLIAGGLISIAIITRPAPKD